VNDLSVGILDGIQLGENPPSHLHSTEESGCTTCPAAFAIVYAPFRAVT
jgi:hypothetical protein